MRRAAIATYSVQLQAAGSCARGGRMLSQPMMTQGRPNEVDLSQYCWAPTAANLQIHVKLCEHRVRDEID